MHGFNGTPVWDEKPQTVIGMISFIKKLGEQTPTGDVYGLCKLTPRRQR